MSDKPSDIEEAPDDLAILITAIRGIYEIAVALRDGDEMSFKIAFKNRRGELVCHSKLEMDDRVRAYLKPIAKAEADSEVPS